MRPGPLARWDYSSRLVLRWAPTAAAAGLIRPRPVGSGSRRPPLPPLGSSRAGRGVAVPLRLGIGPEAAIGGDLVVLNRWAAEFSAAWITLPSPSSSRILPSSRRPSIPLHFLPRAGRSSALKVRFRRATCPLVSSRCLVNARVDWGKLAASAILGRAATSCFSALYTSLSSSLKGLRVSMDMEGCID